MAMTKRVIILGGDGFCGWPTALGMASHGHEVLIIDNLSRRGIDNELSSQSLVNIASIQDRVLEANRLVGNVEFCNIDICIEPSRLRSVLESFNPDVIVHFAEQRAAPYSMIGDKERRYTVNNNVTGTHNLLSAIVDLELDVHVVHLGTMGVYGYSREFGKIPEGYLDVIVASTESEQSILYPANPGSVYHLSKCLDQQMFQFYVKNWGLRITDLHQGIVWGVETSETSKSPILANRFDFDGVYGTVLNRFLVQAVNNFPLTVYGTGGQARAFIHIQDTVNCVILACENDNFERSRVRIFNQASEVYKVGELAKLISDMFNVPLKFHENPRKELADNDLEVETTGLRSLGFDPILLTGALLSEVRKIAGENSDKFIESKVLSSPQW